MTELEDFKLVAKGLGRLQRGLLNIPGNTDILLDSVQDIIVSAYAPVNGNSKPAIVMRETIEADGHEASVYAEGERLGFMEFGTGAWVDADGTGGRELLDDVPFDVESGSWSHEHEQTWENWIAAGKDPEKYPYNGRPTHGFQQGLDHFKNNFDKAVIRRVFNG